MPAKGEALSFIRMHSPTGDSDLLPGLCAFTERWLANVCLMIFLPLFCLCCKNLSESLHSKQLSKANKPNTYARSVQLPVSQFILPMAKPFPARDQMWVPSPSLPEFSWISEEMEVAKPISDIGQDLYVAGGISQVSRRSWWLGFCLFDRLLWGEHQHSFLTSNSDFKLKFKSGTHWSKWNQVWLLCSSSFACSPFCMSSDCTFETPHIQPPLL